MPSLTRHGHSRTARSSVHGVSTGLPGSFVVTGGPRPPGKRGNVCWDGRAGGTFFAPAGCAAFGVVAVPCVLPFRLENVVPAAHPAYRDGNRAITLRTRGSDRVNISV